MHVCDSKSKWFIIIDWEHSSKWLREKAGGSEIWPDELQMEGMMILLWLQYLCETKMAT